MLALSDDGYNVCVGSTPSHMIRFTDYSHHPKLRNAATNSDAAGRYQFMGRYWEHYRVRLDLPDFGPESQDLWAVQLIKECRALPLIEAGTFRLAVEACRSRWASLPGAPYGQPTHSLASLQEAYIAAGGVIAEAVT